MARHLIAAVVLGAGLSGLVPDPASAQAPPSGIEAAELSRLDAWTVSAISRADGALPSSLWTQSDAAFIAALFDRLPATYNSPAIEALARRVLLSGGDAPRGDARAAARSRFAALDRMGEADELAIMAAGAASGFDDPAVAEFAARAELARGAKSLACQRGRTLQTDHPSAFLLHLRAYCAAVGGDRAASDLALELARTAGANDPWYAPALAAAAGSPGARPPPARYDDSLTTSISIAGGLRPRTGSITDASTLSVVTLARAEATPALFRAQAAALALQRGVMSGAEARPLLHASPVDPNAPQLANALHRVEAAPGSLDAATAIAESLRAAASPAEFAAAARLFKDDIATLPAAPDPGAALSFVRAALAAGDLALAQRLVVSARAAGLDRGAIAPIDAAIAVAQGVQGDAAQSAVRQRIDAAGATQARAAARDAAIMVALGAPADSATQSFLLANAPLAGSRPDSGVMVQLRAAARRSASGEAALLAAIAASDGPARLDVDALAQIIGALRDIGLDDDARALAVEALLSGQSS